MKGVYVILAILLMGALALLAIASVVMIVLFWVTTLNDDPGTPYTETHTATNLTCINLDVSTSGANVVHLEEAVSNDLTIEVYRAPCPIITYDGNDSVLSVNIRVLRPEEMRGQGSIVYLYLPGNVTYDLTYDMTGHKDWSTHAVETGKFDGNITIRLNGETIVNQA